MCPTSCPTEEASGSTAPVCCFLVQLTSFGHPFEQAHVNAPLLQGAAEIAEEHFFFHPHLEGPFLLELAAPLSQISLEWDEPWRFYPPFQVRKEVLRQVGMLY